MVSTPEQRKRYKLRHPEKIREQKIRYLDKKVKEKFLNDPNYKKKLEYELLQKFNKLTRLLFKDKLVKHCQKCSSTSDLHIHHKKYCYPILEKDLQVLCRRCHILEHQKTPLPQERETL